MLSVRVKHSNQNNFFGGKDMVWSWELEVQIFTIFNPRRERDASTFDTLITVF
jgi:hypothetical protein